MSIIIQWALCCVIGLAAAGYLTLKYFFHKQPPGSACGGCKGCAATSRLASLGQQDHGGSQGLTRPNG
jgi:hypothetical protein